MIQLNFLSVYFSDNKLDINVKLSMENTVNYEEMGVVKYSKEKCWCI